MKLTIYNDESPQEVMDQLKFVLMEFGVVLEAVETEKDNVTYEFKAAEPLDDEDKK